MKNWIRLNLLGVLGAGFFMGLVFCAFFFWFLFSHSAAHSSTAPSLKNTVPLYQIVREPVVEKRNFLVADVHGRLSQLKDALDDVDFSQNDHLFVLGDTIDRGPEGFRALLDLTKSWPKAGYKVTVLLGNHEEMWYKIAAVGKTDQEQLEHLKEKIEHYKGNVPNGWENSFDEWINLTPEERRFLLNQMSHGFGQPRLLVIQIAGQWLTLSHSANFSKPYHQQTAYDLAWNNRYMRNAPSTYRESLANKLGVPKADVRVFIGHISDILFGAQENFVDLDNTRVFKSNDDAAYREYGEIPVRLYQVEKGDFVP